MKRRDMLKKAIGGGALMAVTNPIDILTRSSVASAEPKSVGNPLRFPPVFTNGGNMTLTETNVTVWPGQNTQAIVINGSYPGPSVVIQKGSVFTANFFNQLNEPATIHWHGVSTPELMDGHPKDAIPPGGNYTYTFPVGNRGGTYFYHAHADMRTAEQVFKGFAGFFIVDDPAELQLNLPRGSFDIPLCLQDHRVADIPQFTYDANMEDVTFGYLGDTVLVNGTPDAYFEVSRTLYRFRILNGSNARVYKIALSDNRPFRIIATDGGLKDEAVEATSFFISPGERVDILFDFSPYTIGQNVTLKSQAFSAPGMGTYRQGTELNIIRFDVTGNQSSGGTVPTSMPPITYYNPAEVKTVRNFVLSMTGGSMNMHKINGLSFEMMRIDWETPLNSLEEWKIVNATNNIHPMHSHEAQFQVYSRNGNTNLPPVDKGWKDTVLVYPFETVRTLIKFTEYRGIYLYHCHNLEHEDDGMMLNFKIVDPVGISEQGEELPDSFRLYQNFPNPFNPTTQIRFELEKGSDVEVNVYDVMGRLVGVLADGFVPAGLHELVFSGSGLSSGEYFLRMSVGGSVRTIKMTLKK
ncbi:MAG: multicopper oxidase domain-containing protein [Ignavibacteria bacterium]|nr:multicopper oxidase domain-containing protein [Ignavibacteria bacterium]